MTQPGSWLQDGDQFRDGVAIVVGGSGGIGREVALALAAAGSNVALTYGRKLALAEDVATHIRSLGREASVTQLAIEDATQVTSFVGDAVARFGSIHSVVYASGPPLHMQFISEITPTDWARVMQVDINGCFNLVHATLPYVRRAKGSYVAVITAAVERVPSRDIQSAAPKAAIEMLMRGVAKEEGRAGVRANCVGPGWIAAGLGQHVMDTELTPAKVQAIVQAIPLKRIGEARDVADAVLFLLSSRARFITGQTIAVDGGMQI
jgi:NAD(P)-dependent dehydrogenase (short-subunit alcohol dehydrogenase family)